MRSHLTGAVAHSDTGAAVAVSISIEAAEAEKEDQAVYASEDHDMPVPATGDAGEARTEVQGVQRSTRRVDDDRAHTPFNVPKLEKFWLICQDATPDEKSARRKSTRTREEREKVARRAVLPSKPHRPSPA